MDEYKFLEKIGRGTHGTVYLLETIQKMPRYVVCKSIIHKYKKYALKESLILSRLSHKRIIRFVESIASEEYIFIIMEYANHGTLEIMLEYFRTNGYLINNKIVWSMLAQLIDALSYLHGQGVIHRDIKPSNILINQFFLGTCEVLEFKICDFSLAINNKHKANSEKNNACKTPVGTPFYMAPEMTLRREYDSSVDVWGLGVTIYEMLSHEKPFAGDTRTQLYRCICDNEITKIPQCKDNKLTSIVLNCLAKSNRINSYELRKIERIKYYITLIELNIRDRQILNLEKRVKELEMLASKNKVGCE
ncbi:Serine/threonine-protein kinase CLA4 [Astathelohania contejeani]|uniref:non-specific serine/threonine protein kinase n=1 Tax=Astathelohania contejeani TaxID=164912 RepID=A0ABQ7HWU7_9MICR|nr:Serine/threonine-protein kinase CLA4 [Thelohania contejeani]